MKRAMFVLGIAGLMMGLLWVGQGFGLVRWPASSFMIEQRAWIGRGAVLAMVGLVLIAGSRARSS